MMKTLSTFLSCSSSVVFYFIVCTSSLLFFFLQHFLLLFQHFFLFWWKTHPPLETLITFLIWLLLSFSCLTLSNNVRCKWWRSLSELFKEKYWEPVTPFTDVATLIFRRHFHFLKIVVSILFFSFFLPYQSFSKVKSVGTQPSTFSINFQVLLLCIRLWRTVLAVFTTTFICQNKLTFVFVLTLLNTLFDSFYFPVELYISFSIERCESNQTELVSVSIFCFVFVLSLFHKQTYNTWNRNKKKSIYFHTYYPTLDLCCLW